MAQHIRRLFTDIATYWLKWPRGKFGENVRKLIGDINYLKKKGMCKTTFTQTISLLPSECKYCQPDHSCLIKSYSFLSLFQVWEKTKYSKFTWDLGNTFFFYVFCVSDLSPLFETLQVYVINLIYKICIGQLSQIQ